MKELAVEIDLELILREMPLLRMRGYYEAFYDEYSRSSCYREAWAKVEARLELAFGVRRYKNYESFKVSLFRWRDMAKREEQWYREAD